MQFTFENNLDDLSALFDYHLNCLKNKKQRLWNAAKFPMFAFFGYIGSLAISRNSVEAEIFGAAMLSIILFGWAWLAYRYLPRKAAKLFQKERPESIGYHTMTISQDGLTDKTADKYSIKSWIDVYNIQYLSNHILIFMPGVEFIIPKRALGDELFIQVGNEIKRLMSSQKTDVFDLW